MKKITLAIALLICSVIIFAEKFSTEIKPLAGEKWYGAYTAKAWCNTPLKDIRFQPFEANTARKDLNDNLGNQVAPLLISNLGRYVWSNEPFAFELKEGSLLLYSDVEKLDVVERQLSSSKSTFIFFTHN